MVWQDLFQEIILERGYDYYLTDHIAEMTVDGDLIKAIVQGDDAYDVEIECVKGNPIAFYCDCPYAIEDRNCKHMAAVLFNYEMNFQSTAVKPAQSIQSIVDETDEKIVKDFLGSILRRNPQLTNEFLQRLAPRTTDLNSYYRKIDKIIIRHAGYENLITVDQVDSFVEDICYFIGEEMSYLMDNQVYLTAFKVTTYLYSEIGFIDIEDEEGELFEIGLVLFEIWEELFDEYDAKNIPEISNWFKAQMKNSERHCFKSNVEEIVQCYF